MAREATAARKRASATGLFFTLRLSGRSTGSGSIAAKYERRSPIEIGDFLSGGCGLNTQKSKKAGPRRLRPLMARFDCLAGDVRKL